MSMRRILLPWDRQPQGAVGIDYTNPLTIGLSAAIVGGRAVNVASGDLGKAMGSAYSAPSSRGLSFASGVSVTDRYQFPAARMRNGSGGGVTLAVMVFPGPSNGHSAGQYTFMRGQFAEEGYVFLMLQGAGSSRAITLQFFSGSYFSAGSVAENAWHTIMLSKPTTASADGTASVDGMIVPTSGYSINREFVTDENLALYVGGYRSGDDRVLRGRLALCLLWDRALSVSEHLAWQANPWRVFAPREIWVPRSAAAGYTHPTLSSPRMIWTGVGAGQPAIDYTW